MQSLGGDPQRLGELAGSELVLDVTSEPALLGTALLHHTDEQDVVPRRPDFLLPQLHSAHRALGREVAADHAPPAERVTAGHGHRLRHQEETKRAVQQQSHVGSGDREDAFYRCGVKTGL